MIIKAIASSFVSRLVRTATLATGFGTLWCLVVLLGGSAIQELSNDPAQKWPDREQIWVRDDGTPLVMITHYSDTVHTRYRDLSGREVERPASAIYSVPLAGDISGPGFLNRELRWEDRLKAFIDKQQPDVIWYFVHDGKAEGAGYFVAYERPSNRRVGFIGLSGFSSGPLPREQWLPVRSPLLGFAYYWSRSRAMISQGRILQSGEPGDAVLPSRWVYVPSGHVVYRVDLRARTLTSVLELREPIEGLGIVGFPNRALEVPGQTAAVVVRTSRTIRAFNPENEAVRSFTFPNEADRGYYADWYETGRGTALVAIHRPSDSQNAENISPVAWYTIGADGTVLDAGVQALKSGTLKRSEERETILLSYALPVPAFLLAVAPLFLWIIDPPGSYPAAIATLLKMTWPALLAVVILSPVLAFVASRRARAFALPKWEQIVWPALVLVFGVPAYAGYLLHRRWPARVACAQCGASAPRDRVECAFCGTPFPEPAGTGIEIFAERAA
jgi:hypothetical protein